MESLNVLLFKEFNGESVVWIAQCLQYDICVQASSLSELKNRLCYVIVATVVLDLEHGDEPFSQFKPAPDKFWRAYNGETVFIDNLPCKVPDSAIEDGDIIPPHMIATMKMAGGDLAQCHTHS